MYRLAVKSSNLKTVGYDESCKVLEIEFNNGNIYHYKNVTEKDASDLLAASSVGKFFNSRIKGAYTFAKGAYMKTNTPNIYICGKAGAGKSVLAKYICEKYGYARSKFAFPVYNIAYDYFDMQGKDRELLQTIGTDAGRNTLDTDIWINRFVEDMAIVKKTREILDMPQLPYVSDDVRFPNEQAALEKAGWVGVCLNAPLKLRIERLVARDGSAQEKMLGHSAEVALDKFSDKLIQLDSSIELAQLCSNFDELLKTIAEK